MNNLKKLISLVIINCILIFVFINEVKAETFVNVGYQYKADVPDYESFGIAYESGVYRTELSYWGEYSRTPWYDSHPEWRDYIQLIPKHYTFSVTKRIFERRLIGRLYFYADLGLTYTSHISDANSTHILFRENVGVRYKDIRLFFRHTSNAGLSGRNWGEDALVFEVTF